jgi:hypothetical protein
MKNFLLLCAALNSFLNAGKPDIIAQDARYGATGQFFNYLKVVPQLKKMPIENKFNEFRDRQRRIKEIDQELEMMINERNKRLGTLRLLNERKKKFQGSFFIAIADRQELASIISHQNDLGNDVRKFTNYMNELGCRRVLLKSINNSIERIFDWIDE